jgi:glycosyltransferase involved in cell wall biosynthesis
LYAYHAALFVKRLGDEFDIIIEEFSPAIPTFLNLYKKRPVVLQVQGYTGKEYFEKYNIFYSTTLYIFERLRPKYYKDIIVVSEATKKRFNLNKKHNIQVISNGISEELFNLETDETDYILYLGRIDIHSKGLDILISAYREFHKFFPKIRLVIAGDGRDMNEFNTMLIDLPGNVRRKIELSGWVSGEEKTEIMSNALFFVFPSRHDVQSIALLEAMAYGKAIVVSDIPELNYVTDCRAGISFKTGDAASLAQCMKDLVTSDERKKMGKKARDWVKGFTWDRVTLKYEKFLHDVLEI